MSVYVTGDTHGEIDIAKLSKKHWPEGRDLDKADYVIVLGDFGLIFHPEGTAAEKYWLNWLDEKPWTTLFVDGNHENHEKLALLPIEEKFGGKVGKVNDSIYHLRRGEIYTLAEKTFFTFGGAVSIDKLFRREGISWWRQEVPSTLEIEYALDNLKAHNWVVDYVLAHTAPESIANKYLASIGLPPSEDDDIKRTDPTAKFLEHVAQTVEFEALYCGHWHDDWTFEKYHLLYLNIVKVI